MNVLIVKSLTFKENYSSLLRIYSWNDTVFTWTAIAVMLNFIFMLKYILQINNNKYLSISFYLLLNIFFGFIWFWLSVIPGLAAYFASGGTMN